MAPLTRCAMASVTSFSTTASRPLHAVIVAAVSGIDHDRSDRWPGCGAEHGQRRGRHRRRGAGSRSGRRRSGRRRRAATQLDRDNRGRALRRHRWRAERAESRAQIHLDRVRVDRANARQQPLLRWCGGQQRIERIGLDADEQSILFLSHGRRRRLARSQRSRVRSRWLSSNCAVTRGTRRSPTTSRREAARKSSRTS